ncbi:dna repair and recombination protein pif1 [Diaporthe amygdali]|uniref:dna repair and recombination protein pif1 n=1 Tax=Phomopsis amygdali TaxID=1214568 RepID=UPI0022FE8C2E|nr:dna repair and recombination protein pif1 [Diaporthe amygdali]KAJ0108653.1 dna repair and recombination protein pif1 [Diaporthe amygdali]
MSMFKRANATYAAQNKAPQPAKPLAKQLFPSSSPSPRRDASIKDQFQNINGSSYGSSKFSQSSKPTGPLQPRSSNSSQSMNPPPQVNRTVNSKPFASLYNSQNSFESPDVIDLTGGNVQASTRGKLVDEVDYFDDDFSDEVDLDYECPSALPPLKPESTPAKRVAEAPPTDSTSVLSWSQSSPTHFQPARSVSQSTNSQGATKRAFTEDADAPPAKPVAKKRSLPPQYLHKNDDDDVKPSSKYGSSTPAAKPQSKPKESRTWDLTPGAIKEQQKLLKNKSKKTGVSGAEASAEDMQQAIKSYTVKQSAISLSSEQEHVKKLVCEKGQSVFFTGPAGTGKSVLMRAIIQDLKKKYAKDPERLAVTASTGLAACNIGGMTLHSFAGIGLGKDDAQTLVKKIRRNGKAKNRWMRTRVLIVDEISMVDGDLFDKLSQVGRIIRNNGRPWGGIQLVITGDFFQLPPVPDSHSRDTKFAFEAATWNTSIDHTIGLTEVFRQKDPVFAQMLNEMRLGHISEQTVETFKKMSRPIHFNDGLEVTELFPTRQEVENSNQRRLRELPGEVHRYEALDAGDPNIRDKLLGNMMAPKVLELKKGAQVMLIKNLDETLVNGSLGTVIGFSTESAFEISGGLFDEEHENGDDVDPKVKKRLAAFSRQLSDNAGPDKKKFPLVQFHAVDGTARIMLCCSEPWKVETPTGEVQASREQLPLILAWALSIHKAQGQTLARVKVDLGKVFEKGQAYVALSRAVTQEGLQVLRFDRRKVMAHPRVVSFYQKLYSAESALKKKTGSSIANFAYKSARPSKTTTMAEEDDEEEAMASYGY